MGFRLTDGPHLVWQTVSITTLDDKGVLRTTKVQMQFELLDDNTVMDALPDHVGGFGDAGREARQQLVDFYSSVTRDWKGFEDSEGKPVEFDAARFEQLLLYPWFSEPVMAAYNDARRGRKSGN